MHEVVTPGELVGRFPEFADAPKGLVKLVLAEASGRTDENVWGDRYQSGVLYLAAHLLAINPSSRNMAKCCTPDGQSSYSRERKRMACAVASGFRVAKRPDC